MKRFVSLTSFLILFLLTVPLLAAQNQATAVQTMAVDIWPDYDRRAALVLLTGTLPAETPLPTDVTLTLPDEAELHVVARITPEGNMVDDLDPALVNGQLTFTTPDSRFRVEYYLPYTTSGDQRVFTYTWQAPLPVEQLEVSVQQPAVATSLTTEPPAPSVGPGENGLTYHILPVTSVAAGQAYTVDVSYNMAVDELTVERQADPATGSVTQPTVVDEGGVTIDWPLLLAGVGILLIVAAITWQVASNRKSQRTPTRPKPKRAVKKAAKGKPPQTATKARFCHECGQALQVGDKFCRHCGTAVKIS